jgi:hypothetical protein
MITRNQLGRASSALALGLALSLGLGGCHKDSAKKADTQTAAAGPKKATKALDEGVEVPTEEDFEEEVAKQITKDTDLQKELDQLDKEIH